MSHQPGPSDPADRPSDGDRGTPSSSDVAPGDRSAAGDSTALLAFWSEQREQMRQSENQRATLTNYTLVVSAALTGLMAQLDFAHRTWPLAAFITVTGLHGAVTAAKYHERANYHLHQARALTRKLVTTGALPDLRDDLTRARADHREQFPALNQLRLHTLWTTLHTGIAAFGLTLLIITLRS